MATPYHHRGCDNKGDTTYAFVAASGLCYGSTSPLRCLSLSADEGIMRLLLVLSLLLPTPLAAQDEPPDTNSEAQDDHAGHEHKASEREQPILEATDDLDRALRTLVEPCEDRLIDKCIELTGIGRSGIRRSQRASTRWQYARLLIVACRGGHEPACQSLTQTGKAFINGATGDEKYMGTKLLREACQDAPAVGCGPALAAAAELMESDKGSKEYEYGVHLMERVCLRGDTRACARLETQGETSPYGRGNQVTGRVLAYAGLGVAVAAATGWGISFTINRCGTRPKRKRNDGQLAGCWAQWALWGLGQTASVVGSRIYLEGKAQEYVNSDDAVGRDSIFIWIGIGAAISGALLPLSVELAARDWRPVIAWTPLIATAVSQVLYLLGRWAGPGPGEVPSMQPAVVHVIDRQGRPKPGLGAAFRF